MDVPGLNVSGTLPECAFFEVIVVVVVRVVVPVADPATTILIVSALFGSLHLGWLEQNGLPQNLWQHSNANRRVSPGAAYLTGEFVR